MITWRGTLRARHATGTARPGPPQEDPKPPAPAPPSRAGRLFWLFPLAMIALVVVLAVNSSSSGHAVSYAYSVFVDKVEAKQVASVSIDGNGAVSGTLKNGTAFSSQIPTALGAGGLEQQLQAAHVQITATPAARGGALLAWLAVLIPFAVILAVLVWLGRSARRVGAGLSTVGRSKAKIIDAERPQTGFADVAGYQGVKREVSEIVDFLRRPERYAAAGAKGPRGVIMVGPPGTGKTLIARAVAGEADVPFLSVTGSAFVEMFVGVGASRVRDLFAEARKRAPSIIFIDEIDAVGGRRGSGGRLGGNDEREQTLNQLLAEMDGFDQSSGIVILAATNRPDALDPALLRPGRFDREVVVPLPNQAERAAILGVHGAGKEFAPDVDLTVVARATPGFSGADLANLVNEAAINAVRDDREIIERDDLDEARDRVLLGRRDSSNALLPEERRAVAVHESGHALVAALCEHADPVAKVTILPSGLTLGVTEQLPEAERHLYSEGYLEDLLAVRLGGRAAELIVFGEGSSGAANDLSGATRIAVRMVREFGLSPELGPVGYGKGEADFLAEPDDGPLARPYAESTQRTVDQEVARLLRRAEQRALGMLREHRAALDDLADLLRRRETLDGSVVAEALGREPGRSPAPARVAVDSARADG